MMRSLTTTIDRLMYTGPPLLTWVALLIGAGLWTTTTIPAYAQTGAVDSQDVAGRATDEDEEPTPNEEATRSDTSPSGEDESGRPEAGGAEATGGEPGGATETRLDELGSPEEVSTESTQAPVDADSHGRTNGAGDVADSAVSSPPAPTTTITDELTTEPQSALTFGADLRLRYEGRSNFKFNDTAPGNNENILLGRLRLRGEWTPVEWFSTYAEVQHASIYFEEAIDQNSYPTVFADTLDIHQVYVDLDPTIGAVPTRLRVGRQKFNLGAQRLIASLEWVNTARVVDGASLRIGAGDGRNATVFASWLVPVDPNRLNRSWDDSGSRMFDSGLHGIYWTDPETLGPLSYDAYYLIRLNPDMGDAIHTVGTRVTAPLGDVRLDSETALQFGTYGDMRHFGYMVHVGAAHLFPSFYNASLGVAYNLGSGDSDPSDDVHETFDNLYPLNHAYYGYMDFFSLQNVHNLEGVARFKPFGLDIRAAIQLFWLVEPTSDSWYNAGGAPINAGSLATTNGFVGSEIDLTIGWAIDHLALHLGYGHFFAGPYVRDAGRSGDADFVYVQSTVSM